MWIFHKVPCQFHVLYLKINSLKWICICRINKNTQINSNSKSSSQYNIRNHFCMWSALRCRYHNKNSVLKCNLWFHFPLISHNYFDLFVTPIFLRKKDSYKDLWRFSLILKCLVYSLFVLSMTFVLLVSNKKEFDAIIFIISAYLCSSAEWIHFSFPY